MKDHSLYSIVLFGYKIASQLASQLHCNNSVICGNILCQQLHRYFPSEISCMCMCVSNRYIGEKILRQILLIFQKRKQLCLIHLIVCHISIDIAITILTCIAGYNIVANDLYYCLIVITHTYIPSIVQYTEDPYMGIQINVQASIIHSIAPTLLQGVPQQS